MRKELEEKFVLAHFLRSNTVACAKAEYHGERVPWSRETQPMATRKYGDREGLGLHGSWHTLAGVFFSVCFTLFPKELTAKDSLAAKEPVKDQYQPHHLLSITFLQVYKDQECLLMTADTRMSKHPGNRQAEKCTAIQCPLDQS